MTSPINKVSSCLKITFGWIAVGVTWLFGGSRVLMAQRSWSEIPSLLNIPKQYIINKTTDSITIDGQGNEKAWAGARWMTFADIVTGKQADTDQKSRCKLLWDHTYLYVFAEFYGHDVWATITRHDAPVFQDNAFEIFINPDRTAFNYFEFQINALGTVWDLFLPRPYRSGGVGLSSWDIKNLKKAVHIAGTLNDPSDKDTGWSVELAIPFASLNIKDIRSIPGTVWRMNFSRVQWQTEVSGGAYKRKTDTLTGRLNSEHYSVWSPVGIIDLHYPERWGYVLFSDNSFSGRNLISTEAIKRELAIWRYYYLQHMYERDYGKFASSISTLDSVARMKIPDSNFEKTRTADLKMYSDEKQFWIEDGALNNEEIMGVDNDGQLHFLKVNQEPGNRKSD